MFRELKEVHRRPEPFEEYTARELWTDPHVSLQMLAYHLDESVDAASRSNDFMDRSAAWIVTHFGLDHGATVADFGCGPGLYAQHLARAGLDITGIDFSLNSLKYAREAAASEDLEIEYIHTDYLAFETEKRFDLIMMIMCDFSALSLTQRVVMLRKFRSMLKPGGALVLDVHSPQMFAQRREMATFAPNLMDGLWSPGEYYGFLNTFKYDRERLVLDKYTIVESHRIRRIYNWFQCFTPREVEQEFANCGLTVEERWSDVAGASYDPKKREFAVVARAATSEPFTS